MDINDLARTVVILSSSFLRSFHELQIEADCMLKDGADERFELIDFNDAYIIHNDELCNDANERYNRYLIADHSYNAVGCGDYHQTHPDDRMDGGFHRLSSEKIDEGRALMIVWDRNNMNAPMDGIELIWSINKMFVDLNETPTDIHVEGLAKHILLNYTVTDYQSFVLSVKWMNTLPRKWCFGRRISISIKTVIDENIKSNQHQIIVQFENVNVFCSVDMMRRWFEKLLVGYNYDRQPLIMNLLNFQFGSFHFIRRQRTDVDGTKCRATVFCQERNLNISSLPNHLHINGAPLQFKDQSYFDNLIHDRHHKFVNYKGPILLELLTNKMHLHYKQRERIENVLKGRRYQYKRTSPPPSQNKLHNQPKIHQLRHEYDSSSTPPPNAKLINTASNVYNECKYEYSSSSSESDYYCNDVQNSEYHNLSAVLQAKHEKYGNAFEGNENKRIFEGDSLNKLCGYCLMRKWSDEHKKECLFIPEWVKNGQKRPSGKAAQLEVFHGYHFL